MNTQQIRNWLITNIFNSLRGKPDLEITLRAGNIHAVLALKNSYPTVCAALATVHANTNGIDLLTVHPGPKVNTIPPRGSNVWYTYRIN